MPKYKIICTHNPQDFFNGDKSPELSLMCLTDDLNADVPRMLDGGYKIIVTYAEGEGDG